MTTMTKKVSLIAAGMSLMTAAQFGVADTEPVKVGPLKIFSANTTARASEVNGNFSTVQSTLNELGIDVAELVDRLEAVEDALLGNGGNGPDNEVTRDVEGRCYSFNGYDVSSLGFPDSGPTQFFSSGVRSGYLFFDANGQGRQMLRADTLNRFFTDEGGDDGQREDQGELGDYINTEYRDQTFTWSQSQSVVQAERGPNGSSEVYRFSVSKAGDMLFSTQARAEGNASSAVGDVRLVILSEMDCADAESDAAVYSGLAN